MHEMQFNTHEMLFNMQEIANRYLLTNILRVATLLAH